MPPGGLEPPTKGLGNLCSIHLSYGGTGRRFYNLARMDCRPGEPGRYSSPTRPSKAGTSRRRIVSSRRGPVETITAGASISRSMNST